MPSVPLPNYAFINDGRMNFTNLSDSIGLGLPGFSNGSAYGDLDNDGDLDLVINNVNMESFIYRNNSELINKNSFLKIELKDNSKNTNAIGSK